MEDGAHPLVALLGSVRVDKFRYGPEKPLVVLRAQWPVERALKVLLRHSITCAVCVPCPALPRSLPLSFALRVPPIHTRAFR